jgi:hypothetical protein
MNCYTPFLTAVSINAASYRRILVTEGFRRQRLDVNAHYLTIRSRFMSLEKHILKDVAAGNLFSIWGILASSI